MSSSAKVRETYLLKCAPRKPTRPPPGLGHRPSRSPAPTPTPVQGPLLQVLPHKLQAQAQRFEEGEGWAHRYQIFPSVFQTSAELFYALSSKCQSSRITDPSNLSFPTVLHPPIPGLETPRPWGWGKGEWEKTERASVS